MNNTSPGIYQLLDSGRHDFRLVLPGIVSAIALMQVAVGPDKPAFAASLSYFLRELRKATKECRSTCFCSKHITT